MNHRWLAAAVSGLIGAFASGPATAQHGSSPVAAEPSSPGGMRSPERSGHGREWRREVMEQLDLTSQQKQKVAEIRDRQQRAAIEQRARIQIARLDLQRLMRADAPDREAVLRQVDEIAKLTTELRKSQVGAMLDVRAVLTPAQRGKLRDLRMGWEDEGEEAPDPSAPRR